MDKVLDRCGRVLGDERIGEAGVSMCDGREALLLRRGSLR